MKNKCQIKKNSYLCIIKQTEILTKKNQKKMEATISKSIYGKSYSVEEKIGSTFFHSHFDSLEEAITYCKKRNYNYKII